MSPTETFKERAYTVSNSYEYAQNNQEKIIKGTPIN